MRVRVCLGSILRACGRPLLTLCLGALVVGVGATAAQAKSRAGHVIATHGTIPLRTALLDGLFNSPQSATAFAMTRAAGATYVRLQVSWSAVAPGTKPVGFVASDPNSPGYTWQGYDTIVQAAEAAGLTPILDVLNPPTWGYAVQPKGVRAGRPKVSALRAFAKAIATHYDGQHGAPRVRVFQVWNEPNVSLYLYPKRAAVTYRNMINAFAASVHAVDKKDFVVAGGLDPFANVAKRFVTQAPLAFMRSVLCVSMGNPKAKKAELRRPHATCKKRVHFDAWSTHPYTFNGPFGHARRKDDVSLGDLPKMRKVLRTARKLHRQVSARPAQFWVTEFSWDTNPPRRGAAPIHLQARWTSEALYQMWRSGVSLVTWYLLQDQPKPSVFESGLYFYSKSLTRARAKPTRQAFRFPFVAYRANHGSMVRIWGRDATSDKRLVTIQRRHGSRGRWKTVARIRANRVGIFEARLRLASTTKDWLRAVAPQSGKSLAFSLKRPSSKLRYGPWGN